MVRKSKTTSEGQKPTTNASLSTGNKKNGKKNRIEPREAALAAAQYYQNVTGYPGQGASIEEIELSDDGARWRVTLGLQTSIKGLLLGPKEYKSFEVDAYTGEVLSMKIRQL